MVEKEDKELSIVQQCILLSICRSGIYYNPVIESDLDLEIMREIDKCYTEHPFYGSRRMSNYLKELGYQVGRKRVRSYYIKMGIWSIYPKKSSNSSQPNKEDKKYPYLLRNLTITRVNQVWASDITYIPMAKGSMYLCAIIDLYSRCVLSWGISNTMETEFCIEVLNKALQQYGQPEIFNTDQGSQFTSQKFTSILIGKGIRVSMDGKGRALDNIFIERLWRSVKYECIYINVFENGIQLYHGLNDYFRFYNTERKHQSIENQTPETIYNKIV